MKMDSSPIVTRIFRSVIWLVIVVGTALVVSQYLTRPAPRTFVVQGETMGSDYILTIVESKNHEGSVEVKKQVDRLLDEINQEISTYIPNSEISRFNDSSSTDWVPVSSDIVKLCLMGQKLSRLSDGAFDVTVGPLVDAWGFGPSKPSNTPSNDEISAILARVGFEKLEIQVAPPALRKAIPNLRIDLSALGQGFAVDRIAKLLMEMGYDRFRVNVSGEMYARGVGADGKDWPIRIETPRDDTSGIFATLRISNQSFATSGDYRNFIIGDDGLRYSHTISPKTGKPVRHSLASASIVSDDCLTADGISTLMMAVGTDRALALADRENWKVFLIYREGTGFQSKASKRFAREIPIKLSAQKK